MPTRCACHADRPASHGAPAGNVGANHDRTCELGINTTGGVSPTTDDPDTATDPSIHCDR